MRSRVARRNMISHRRRRLMMRRRRMVAEAGNLTKTLDFVFGDASNENLGFGFR
jgi:hypothetical protein